MYCNWQQVVAFRYLCCRSHHRPLMQWQPIAITTFRHYLLVRLYIYSIFFYENPHLPHHLRQTPCVYSVIAPAGAFTRMSLRQCFSKCIAHINQIICILYSSLWSWVSDNKSTFLLRWGSDGVVMIASGPFPFFSLCFYLLWYFRCFRVIC